MGDHLKKTFKSAELYLFKINLISVLQTQTAVLAKKAEVEQITVTLVNLSLVVRSQI